MTVRMRSEMMRHVVMKLMRVIKEFVACVLFFFFAVILLEY